MVGKEFSVAAIEQCKGDAQEYSAPGGFTLLAKIERVRADGTPFPGKYRWVTAKIPPLSLTDYLGRLFLEKPGYFRIIGFVVTDEVNFGHSDDKLPSLGEGGTDLPAEIGALPFKGRNCYTLIYSFERKSGQPAEEIMHDDLSAKSHLQKAGLLNVFTGESK